jgi:hypothetical protein
MPVVVIIMGILVELGAPVLREVGVAEEEDLLQVVVIKEDKEDVAVVVEMVFLAGLEDLDEN